MVHTDNAGLTQAEADKRLAADGPNTLSNAANETLRAVIGAFWALVPW
jgi:hypothetical protein